MKAKSLAAALLVCTLSFALATQAAPPPGAEGAKAALEKSPRHGEWANITVPGSQTPLKSYVVYPESKEKTGVVIVIHEIFGLSEWVRAVADQLAADGFIAIAPDFLSGKGPNGGGTDSLGDGARQAIGTLSPDEVNKAITAAMEYGKKLPASNGKTATIGFCWGGAKSFTYATVQPDLNAAVVYYGTNPANADELKKVKAPVLGLYGGDDARVNSTIEGASKVMKDSGKTYQHHIYEGAGHGFLRQQSNREANGKAAQQAWPATVNFLKEHLK